MDSDKSVRTEGLELENRKCQSVKSSRSTPQNQELWRTSRQYAQDFKKSLFDVDVSFLVGVSCSLFTRGLEVRFIAGAGEFGSRFVVPAPVSQGSVLGIMNSAVGV